MAYFVTCGSDRPSDGGLAQVVSSSRVPRLGGNGIARVLGPYSSFAKAAQIADDWNHKASEYIDAYVTPVALIPFERLSNWFYDRAQQYADSHADNYLDSGSEYY